MRATDLSRGPVVAGLILGVTALACSDRNPPETEGPAFTTHDSAGITIVENFQPAWGPDESWTIAAQPEVVIGAVEADDPAFLLASVVGAVRLSDGRIAILEGQSRELRIFGADGDHLTTLGGPGEGPGELEAPRSLERLPGDTLQIVDRVDRIRFAPDGTLVSDERIDLTGLRALGRYLGGYCVPVPLYFRDYVLECTGPLSQGSRPPGSADGLFEPARQAVVRVAWDLSRVDTLDFFAGAMRYRLTHANGIEMLSHPLYPRRIATLGGNPPRLLVARTDLYEIRLWDLETTRLERIIRHPGTERVPTEEEIDAGFERAASRIEGFTVSDLKERMPRPGPISALTGIFTDTEGNLWVRVEGLNREDDGRVSQSGPDDPPEPGQYEVFDREGRLLGAVIVPPGLSIAEVGADYVLAVRRNELDVPFVERYGLLNEGRRLSLPGRRP